VGGRNLEIYGQIKRFNARIDVLAIVLSEPRKGNFVGVGGGGGDKFISARGKRLASGGDL